MTGRSGTQTRSRRAGSSNGGSTFDLYQVVTDEIIARLEAGTTPWHQPWLTNAGLPLRMSNRKPYRGLNVLLLGMQAMAKGYMSPWWGTFDKIKTMGGSVKGEKSTMVVFWKRLMVDGKDPLTGKPEKKIIPLLRYFRVFNADQVTWDDGTVPAFMRPAERTPLERIEAAQAIADGYKDAPAIRTGLAAYYEQDSDTITMPPFEDFKSPEGYHATLFHEQAHSTGVDKRLKRPGFSKEEFGRFGSAPYSVEELTAELTALFLSASAGIAPVVMDNSAAYLASWLRNLREDPHLIVTVAARAQRAADFILGTKFEAHEDEGE